MHGKQLSINQLARLFAYITTQGGKKDTENKRSWKKQNPSQMCNYNIEVSQKIQENSQEAIKSSITNFRKANLAIWPCIFSIYGIAGSATDWANNSPVFSNQCIQNATFTNIWSANNCNCRNIIFFLSKIFLILGTNNIILNHYKKNKIYNCRTRYITLHDQSITRSTNIVIKTKIPMINWKQF